MEKLIEQRKKLTEVDLQKLGKSKGDHKIERCIRRELWVIDGMLYH